MSSDFNSLDQYAQEQHKLSLHRRISLWLAVAVVLLFCADQIVFWRKSSRSQLIVEQTIVSLRVPDSTVSDRVRAGHQAHKGFASMILHSQYTPREMCDFYVPTLGRIGWTIAEQPCGEQKSAIPLYNAGDVVFKARNGIQTLELKYLGRTSNTNNYLLSDSWYDP